MRTDAGRGPVGRSRALPSDEKHTTLPALALSRAYADFRPADLRPVSSQSNRLPGRLHQIVHATRPASVRSGQPSLRVALPDVGTSSVACTQVEGTRSLPLGGSFPAQMVAERTPFTSLDDWLHPQLVPPGRTDFAPARRCADAWAAYPTYAVRPQQTAAGSEPFFLPSRTDMTPSSGRCGACPTTVYVGRCMPRGVCAACHVSCFVPAAVAGGPAARPRPLWATAACCRKLRCRPYRRSLRRYRYCSRYHPLPHARAFTCCQAPPPRTQHTRARARERKGEQRERENESTRVGLIGLAQRDMQVMAKLDPSERWCCRVAWKHASLPHDDLT